MTSPARDLTAGRRRHVATIPRRASRTQLAAWTDTVIALGSDRDEVTILQRAVDRAVAIACRTARRHPTRLAAPPHRTTPDRPDRRHQLGRHRRRRRRLAVNDTRPPPATASDQHPTTPPTPESGRTSRPAARPPGPGSPPPTATNRTGRSCAATENSVDATENSTPSSTPLRTTPATSSTPPAADSSPSPTSTRSSATPTTTRTARKHWILEHWPHVVEYAEISRHPADQTLGPRPRRSFAGIDDRRHRRRPRHSAHRRSTVAAGGARRARPRRPHPAHRRPTRLAQRRRRVPDRPQRDRQRPARRCADRHRRPRRVPGSPRRPRPHPGAAGAPAGRPGPRRRDRAVARVSSSCGRPVSARSRSDTGAGAPPKHVDRGDAASIPTPRDTPPVRSPA